MPNESIGQDDELIFDYVFDGSLVNRYKKLAWEIAQVVPELDYVEEEDFDVIIAKMAPPKSGGRTVIAEMNYVTHWMKQYVEYGLERELPPYIMILYPVIFKLPRAERVRVIIHELFHIKPNKRGCRPHIGFGDELIYKMYQASLKKLKKV